MQSIERFLAIGLLAATPHLASATARCAPEDARDIPAWFTRGVTTTAALGHDWGSTTPSEVRESLAVTVPMCAQGAVGVGLTRRAMNQVQSRAITGAYSRPVGTDWVYGLRLGAADDGTLLARRSLGLDGSVVVRPGWVLVGSADWRQYSSDRVAMLGAAVDHYLPGARVSAGLTAARVNGSSLHPLGYLESTLGEGARRVSLRLFAGRQPEAVPDGVLVRTVRGATSSFHYRLVGDFALTAVLGLTDRERAGIRRTAEVGFSLEF